MKLGDHEIYIIAEVGSNHGSCLETALAYIDACSACGVDAVKFQSWRALCLQNAMDVADDGTLTPSKVIPVLERLELPDDWHPRLADHCRARGVDFLSTPFDVGRARMLADLGVAAIKVSSSDLTYDELVAEVGGYGIPVLLSTGMANLEEVGHALSILGPDRNDVVLMQCTAAYPPRIEDANLRAITTLRETFGTPVGISDHYPGHDTVVAAVALGATVVEKHVTMSRDAGTPDAPFAIEIDELRELVGAVRNVERALGTGEKICQESERGGLRGGRRGLYAACDLRAGEVISRDSVAVVRPNVGQLQPRDLDRIIGAYVMRDIPAGTPLHPADVGS
jgi:sialic acid synthase SpsE